MNVLEKLAATAGNASSAHANEPPSEYLRILAQRGRPSEVMPFPRIDSEGKPAFEFRMIVLSQQELDQARISAERYTRECLKVQSRLTDEQIASVRKEAWSEIFDDAKCIELLCLAMREKDGVADGSGTTKYRPLFPSAGRVRELLTTDEIAALFNLYSALQFRYGPTWRMLDDEEVKAILDRIEEGAEAYPFWHLQHGQLAQLTASMALMFRSLKTATGSAGLPSDDTASEPSLKSPDSAE